MAKLNNQQIRIYTYVCFAQRVLSLWNEHARPSSLGTFSSKHGLWIFFSNKERKMLPSHHAYDEHGRSREKVQFHLTAPTANFYIPAKFRQKRK